MSLVKKTSTELLNPEGQILVLEGKASPNFESAKPNEALPVLISSLHCLPTSRNRPVMKIITFFYIFPTITSMWNESNILSHIYCLVQVFETFKSSFEQGMPPRRHRMSFSSGPIATVCQ